MSRATNSRIGRYAAVIAITFAMAAPVLAQGNIRSVVRYRVKPDRAADFRAVNTERNTILKKAGWDRAGTWWASQSGPFEYVLVTYSSKWADLDMTLAQNPKLAEFRPQLAALQARQMQCIESAEREIDEIQTDLSLPMTPDLPKMVRVLTTKVKADKVNEYIALMKSDLFPAVKKAGLKTFGIARMRYGAPSTVFRSVMALSSWADLDGPPAISTAMGQDAYRQFLAKLTPLVVESEYTIYRFLPDMSYLPQGGAPSSSGN
jgi:hypothetical protein